MGTEDAALKFANGNGKKFRDWIKFAVWGIGIVIFLVSTFLFLGYRISVVEACQARQSIAIAKILLTGTDLSYANKSSIDMLTRDREHTDQAIVDIKDLINSHTSLLNEILISMPRK